MRVATLSRAVGAVRPLVDGSVGSIRLRPSARQRAARNLSLSTSSTMLRTAMCFAPQGDTMTSRRLFDALAAGCVPVVLKCLGHGRSELALGNLPFPHTLRWRALALFLMPRRTRLSDREGAARGERALCRREQAEWLAAQYANRTRWRALARAGRRAFEAALDVEFGPEGVAHAMLRELRYVLEDTPAMTWRSHPLSWWTSAKRYRDLNLVMPPPMLRREPKWELDESPALSRFTGDTLVEECTAARDHDRGPNCVVRRIDHHAISTVGGGGRMISYKSEPLDTYRTNSYAYDFTHFVISHFL